MSKCKSQISRCVLRIYFIKLSERGIYKNNMNKSHLCDERKRVWVSGKEDRGDFFFDDPLRTPKRELRKIQDSHPLNSIFQNLRHKVPLNRGESCPWSMTENLDRFAQESFLNLVDLKNCQIFFILKFLTQFEGKHRRVCVYIYK